MEKIAKAVRHKVSNDRSRFIDGKYDLDLTYITPNLIAMSFPAKGVETLWRNKGSEVMQMLNEYHKDSFLILNLSERKWDHPVARAQLLEFGFRDHHAPPLKLLFEILTTIHSWLSADPKNVVVVHCQGGKGRTGTVIASYLLYAGKFATSEEALEYFGLIRSVKGNGVVQASQRRYVEYVRRILLSNTPPAPRNVKLERIIVSSAPTWAGAGSRLLVQVRRVPSHDLICGSHDPRRDPVPLCKPEQSVKFEFGALSCLLKGDVLVEFHHQAALGTTHYLFSCYFHTSFIQDNGIFLQACDLDRLHKTDSLRVDPSMFVNLIFEDLKDFVATDQLPPDAEDLAAEEFCIKFSCREREREREGERERASGIKTEPGAESPLAPGEREREREKSDRLHSA